MNNTQRFTSVFLIAAILVLAGCTTYVQQPNGQAQQMPPQYDYNPGYNPDNTVADAILAAAIINGVSGYYGPGHIFYPSVMYGGVPGYYVGGVFHTSTQYRTTIVNNYNTGRSDFQRNPAQYAQSHPAAVVVKNDPGKPSFGSQSGGMTKGAAASLSSSKPSFGSQSGSMTRGAASLSPSKPSFGSQSGGMSHSASSSSSSRPSSSSSNSSSSSHSSGSSHRH